jgi:hypothetical protein
VTDEQREALDRVAHALRRRRLETAAIFTLESLRPLSFVASQALLVLGPIIQAIVPMKDFDLFCQAMEDRRNVDYLVDQLTAPAPETPVAEPRGSAAEPKALLDEPAQDPEVP